jgi:hydrogenase expression/formation protein HypE
MTLLDETRGAPRFADARIEMAHGAGGKASRRLIEGLIAPLFANPVLAQLGDAALTAVGGAGLALTADGYVVKPLRFPGGSIGELAINGTVNDLAVSGARPRAVLVSLILEAGLESAVLREELEAMAAAAAHAGVSVVGGDTKVVEHGMCDGMYVATFGVGEPDPRLALGPRHVRDGDRVLLSGPIGDHGITILLARGELELEAELRSDTRSLWPLVAALIERCAPALRWMRDPTRGGVATALNELARESGLGIVLDEGAIPVREGVRGACELLGLDPLLLANEGKLVVFLPEAASDAALAALRAHPLGRQATRIGRVTAEDPGLVVLRTPVGGRRILDLPVAEPLPRIC